MQNSDYPALHEAGSNLSMTAQKYFFLALGCNLISLVVAAILSVLNQPDVRFAYAQVVTLILSLGCTIYVAVEKPHKLWYGGRALAESVKTITWRYMMRAEPYNSDDISAKQKFATTLYDILSANKEISQCALSSTNTVQITAIMEDKRRLSLSDRKLFYDTYRINDQLLWYRKKAHFNKQRSKCFLAFLILINLIAIVFAILKISFPTIQYWPTDIFIAAAGSVMAWIQAKRYQELSSSYTLTSNEISILQTRMPQSNLENDFSLFVSDAENAFSREHTQWLARRDQ